MWLSILEKEGAFFMWKKPVFAFVLGSALLVGCNNTADEAVNDVQDVGENVGQDINEGVNDVQEGAEDLLRDDSSGNLNNEVNNNTGTTDLGDDLNGNTGTLNNNDNPVDEDGQSNSDGAGQNINGNVDNNDERVDNDTENQ